MKAQEHGLIQSLVQNLIPNGVSMLRYADNTIFMFKDDLKCARNIKLICMSFEHISGLEVNFHKSDVYVLVMLRTNKKAILLFLLVLQESCLLSI